MSILRGVDEDRQVIPRWRTFGKTVEAGELSSLRWADPIDASVELGRLRQNFVDSPSVYGAADLLSALVATGHGESGEIAEVTSFLAGVETLPTPLGELIGRIVSGEGSASLSEHDAKSVTPERQVASLRRRVVVEPRNAIAWVDLALAHSTLGNKGKALRAIEAALSIAGTSRFVLRTSSRLFLHQDDPERAFEILNRSGRSAYDPWIAAAELSSGQIAFGRPDTMRLAREMLIDTNFSAFDLSELAGEVATIELAAGHDRVAKRLFAQALEHPNENTVAQASTLSEKADVGLRPELLDILGGSEARAVAFSREGRWMEATAEAVDWASDQPFATGPALFGSYTAAIGVGDFELAYDIADRGLRANPDDPMLHNNAAFSLAQLDRPAEAREHLQKSRSIAGLELLTADATEGLILFREGNIAAGRAAYQGAIEALQDSGEARVAAVATALWAGEELRQGTAVARRAVEVAESVAQATRSRDADAVLARLRES